MHLCDGGRALGTIPGSPSPLRCLLGFHSTAAPYPLPLLQPYMDLLCTVLKSSVTWHHIIAALKLFWWPEDFWEGLRWRKEGFPQHPSLEPFQKFMSIGKQGSILCWALKILFRWVVKTLLNTDFEAGPCSNSGCWLLEIMDLPAKVTM